MSCASFIYTATCETSVPVLGAVSIISAKQTQPFIEEEARSCGLNPYKNGNVLGDHTLFHLSALGLSALYHSFVFFSCYSCILLFHWAAARDDTRGCYLFSGALFADTVKPQNQWKRTNALNVECKR